MGYKLIACDLDETLLNDKHMIPQKNLDAITKAREEYGVKFVPATGRGYRGITRELKTLGLYDEAEEYTLSFNGGALTENKGNRIIAFKGLSFEKTKEIFTFGLSCDVCQHVYTKDTLYVFNIS
jgi:HAD superfamily hydrolase (TIGR01484 family)